LLAQQRQRNSAAVEKERERREGIAHEQQRRIQTIIEDIHYQESEQYAERRKKKAELKKKKKEEKRKKAIAKKRAAITKKRTAITKKKRATAKKATNLQQQSQPTPEVNTNKRNQRLKAKTPTPKKRWTISNIHNRQLQKRKVRTPPKFKS
jgi:hypothetical protein